MNNFQHLEVFIVDLRYKTSFVSDIDRVDFGASHLKGVPESFIAVDVV